MTGRPNVGKSTLMNTILGEKISITSAKPQTTRNRIHGVYTKDDTQIVFVDTPGLLTGGTSKHKLDDYMKEASVGTIGQVDLVLMVVEAGLPKTADEKIIQMLQQKDAMVVLVINKIDTISSDKLLASIAAFRALYDFEEIVPVSAKTGKNMDELMKVLESLMQEGPFFFPEDELTDQPERALAAEFIREKALRFLQEEIPHGIAVVIDTFDEREDKPIIDINATIICEKESHKPIIIGKGGAMLKKIGQAAREDMEELFGTKVNLKLWVKIKERWRDSDYLVKNFGFDKKEL